MNMHEVEILRIYIGEDDKHDGKPLYEALIDEARSLGLAGAFVTRGMLGFGAHGVVHTARILELSHGLPLLVEIVDRPERIASVLPRFEKLVGEGMLLVCPAQAVFRGRHKVSEVMSLAPVCVSPETPLEGVLRLLLDKRLKCLVVMQDSMPVGLITGGDLLKRAGMQLRLSLVRSLPSEAAHGLSLELAGLGLCARDVMSSPVISVSPGEWLTEAARIMEKKALKRLPVLSPEGELLGIVSRADILRGMTKAAMRTADLPSLPAGLKLCARDVMFSDLPLVAPDTPLEAVLDKLLRTPLRRVVVVDEKGTAAGIILDGDLLSRFGGRGTTGMLKGFLARLTGQPPKPLQFEGKASDVMQKEIFKVLEDARLVDVMAKMLENGIKRILVVDRSDRPVGMIDRDTLLAVVAKE